MDRIVGERKGLDRTLLLFVTGMVALSFSNPAWQSLHALGWILMIAVMIRRGRWSVPGPRRWAIPWAIFAAWVVLASALGPEPAVALRDTKKLLNLLAIFLLGAVLRTAGEYARILAATCVVMSVQAALALYQFATTTDHMAFRARGTLGHHMTFSGMLLVTLCLVLPLLTFRRGRSDLLWWGYTGLGLAALLVTLTRSAWIGLAVALAVVISFKNPRWLWALPVALAVLFAAVPALRGRTMSILDTRGDYSNVQRLAMYPTALRIIADHPFVGVGGRRQVRARYPDYEGTPPTPPELPGGVLPEPYETPDHLHNDVLQIAAAFGLPALLAWLAALAVFVREGWRALSRRDTITDEAGRLRRNLVLGSLAATAGFLTMGMLEYNFGDSEVSILFFFTLSIPFVLRRSTRTVSREIP